MLIPDGMLVSSRYTKPALYTQNFLYSITVIVIGVAVFIFMRSAQSLSSTDEQLNYILATYVAIKWTRD
jgi:hypothetical protein